MSNFSDDGWDAAPPKPKAATTACDTGSSSAFNSQQGSFGSAKPALQNTIPSSFGRQPGTVKQPDAPRPNVHFQATSSADNKTHGSFGRMDSAVANSNKISSVMTSGAKSIDSSDGLSQSERLEFTESHDEDTLNDDSKFSDDEWGAPTRPAKPVIVRVEGLNSGGTFGKANAQDKKTIIMPPTSIGISKTNEIPSQFGTRGPLSPPSIVHSKDSGNAGFGKNVRKDSLSDDEWGQSTKAPVQQKAFTADKPQSFGFQKEQERAPSFVNVPPSSGQRFGADESMDSWRESTTVKPRHQSDIDTKPVGFGTSDNSKPQGFGTKFDSNVLKDEPKSATKEPANLSAQNDTQNEFFADDSSTFGYSKWSQEASLFGKNEIRPADTQQNQTVESVAQHSIAGFGEPKKKLPAGFGGNFSFADKKPVKSSPGFDVEGTGFFEGASSVNKTNDSAFGSRKTTFNSNSNSSEQKISEFGKKDDGFGQKFSGFGASAKFGQTSNGSVGFGGKPSGGVGFGGFGGSSGGFGSHTFGETDSNTGEQNERPRDNNCRNCNQPGHFARDCQEPRVERPGDGTCRNCNQPGHIAKDCTAPPVCRYCKSEGHSIDECPTKKPMVCFNCQQEGHRGNECTNERVERVPTEPCYRCSETGHFSRDCPTRPRDADGNIIPPFEMKLIADEELFEGVSDNVREVDDNQDVTLSRGRKVPRINSFKEITLLPHQVLQNLDRMMLKKPTKIQQASFNEIYNGKDVVAAAHTGCGKTLAFLLPLVTKLMQENWSDDGVQEEVASPRLLIIAPTRELAAQTYTTVRQVTYKTGLTTSIVYGGTSRSGNKQNLLAHKKLSILVATMGRLNDFIETADVTLSKLKYVVLDEADRMVDTKDFGEQVNNLLGSPNERTAQVCLFSASFSDNLQETDLPKVVKDDYTMIDVNKFGTANENITQFILPVPRSEKISKLTELLELDEQTFSAEEGCRARREKTLIFVNSIKFADTLASMLGQAGLAVISMHSLHNQQLREETLESFRKGRYNVMVASNVCARGLNINGLDHVINYDLPNSDGFDEYVNRIGRTGRAGFVGTSTAFFCEENDMEIVDRLVTIIKEANKELPDWLFTLQENRNAAVIETGDEEAW